MPTQNVSSYYAQVTPNMMGDIFRMQIPRLFADVFTCTFSELDQFEADFAVVLSAMREIPTSSHSRMTRAGRSSTFCLHAGSNHPHVLQLGDKCLYKQLARNPSSNPEGLRQMQSIVHVEYKGKERARVGMAQGGIQVIQRFHPPLQLAVPSAAQAAQQAAQHTAQQAAAAQQASAAQHVVHQAGTNQHVAQEAAAAQHAAQQATATQHKAQQAAAAQHAAQQQQACDAAVQAAFERAAHEQQQQAAAQAAAKVTQQTATQGAQNLNQHLPGALLAEQQRGQQRAAGRNAETPR